ncbi:MULTISPECIES: hypothetical protein [unclassified Streptomyces]|uniref:hypothetical protein n=1 Tax=unclassified Streptomyces TaxID=2593676 RepID=UPI00331F193C
MTAKPRTLREQLIQAGARIRAFGTAVLLVALVVLAVMAQIGSARSDDGSPHRPAAVTVTISAKPAPDPRFRAGYTNAKVDDCEQGFKAACDWLRAH